eukprot:99353-Chlamydomonas_euryale.AAC.1
MLVWLDIGTNPRLAFFCAPSPLPSSLSPRFGASDAQASAPPATAGTTAATAEGTTGPLAPAGAARRCAAASGSSSESVMRIGESGSPDRAAAVALPLAAGGAL